MDLLSDILSLRFSGKTEAAVGMQKHPKFRPITVLYLNLPVDSFYLADLLCAQSYP